MDLNKDVAAHYAPIGDARLTPDRAEPGDGQPRHVHRCSPPGRPVRDRPAAPAGCPNRRPNWRTTPRRSTPNGSLPSSTAWWTRRTPPSRKTPAARATSRRPSESTAPLTYIGWGKTTQLGSGLGFAMGAKLARPGHHCINVWGDAAIGFTGDGPGDRRASGSRSCRACSTICPWPSRYRSRRSSRRSTGRRTSPGTTPTWPARSAATASGSPTPGDIVTALKRGIAATEQGQPALLEFITD